nr:minor capsid protein [synthetic construct]
MGSSHHHHHHSQDPSYARPRLPRIHVRLEQDYPHDPRVQQLQVQVLNNPNYANNVRAPYTYLVFLTAQQTYDAYVRQARGVDPNSNKKKLPPSNKPPPQLNNQLNNQQANNLPPVPPHPSGAGSGGGPPNAPPLPDKPDPQQGGGANNQSQGSGGGNSQASNPLPPDPGCPPQPRDDRGGLGPGIPGLPPGLPKGLPLQLGLVGSDGGGPPASPVDSPPTKPIAPKKASGWSHPQFEK